MSQQLRVNETFLSLQGEGYWTGTAAFFIRLSGCNLRCPFCDTDHAAGLWRSASDVAAEAAACTARHVVLTGGEPTLQGIGPLIEALHAAGKRVAIETNGTRPVPEGVDWVTLSPKDAYDAAQPLCLTACDELKVVFSDAATFRTYPDIRATHRFVQPCDVGEAEENRRILRAAIDYCLTHPAWRLSLQTHKLCNIK